MKLGIICHTRTGGSATIACELARQLGARGHVVHLIGRTHPARIQPFPPNVEFHSVPALSFPASDESLPILEFASVIAQVAIRENLDLLHAHYSVPHAISAQLARAMVRSQQSLPVITTLHGTDVTTLGREPEFSAVARLAITGSDAVTAVSHSLAHETSSLFRLPPVPVIPNFIDPATFSPGTRRIVGDPTQSVLIHVSNFRPVKRAPDCLRIFGLIRRQHSCRLVMVGDGPELPAARELARDLGLEPYVEFVGDQPDVQRWLGSANVLLLPSETEAFGMAALEAMACGVPVVASRVGGLPELVEDGTTGRLLPPGDVAGMAAATLEILSHPRLAERLAQSAVQRAADLFSPDRIIPLYLDLYERTLGDCRRRPTSE